MNHISISDRPKLICRMARSWVAIFGPAGSRHCETCPDCQDYFAAADALEHALKRDARRADAVFPAGLDERIIRAVNQSAHARQPQRSRRGAPIWMLAGVAACAAVAVVVFRSTSVPGGSGPSAGPIDLSAIVSADSPPARLWNSLQPAAGELLSDTSLETEVDSVYADARSAIRFLSLNFLPEVPSSLQDPNSASASRRTVGG
jgi:hypothetical protein